jgi:sarcosine oxidase subunit alpha
VAGKDDPLLVRPAGESLGQLRWAGEDWVDVGPRDTVTSALLTAGVCATSRSLKLRRHRGPYCLRGDCGTCLVRIDGRPNRRACLAAAASGMQVDPQNVLTPSGPDPTALADKLFSEGMDHHHFMVRPRFVNQIMQGVARNLAGLGTLPSHEPDAPARHEHHSPDVLVIGGGEAGRALARRTHTAGLETIVVDRIDAGGHLDPMAIDHAATGVFGIYGVEGLVAAMTHGSPEVLRTFRARHVVLATGATEPLLPFENNDLPGVVAARGLVSLLHRTGLRPAGPVLVVGDGPAAVTAGKDLQADVVALQDVVAVHGGSRVESLEVRGRKIPCRMVAVAPAPAPASDLARQAEAEVRFSGSGFEVVRDAQGQVVSRGPWQLWAAGEVAGVDRHEAADDGHRVGESIVAAARTSAGGRAR